MIDSNLVKSDDYEIYFSKLFIEAKQELKKQAINEKKKLIKMASDKDVRKEGDEDEDDNNDSGNERLKLYSKLLLPFWRTNINVEPFFQQLLQSSDKKLKYSTVLVLLKNNKAVPDSVLNYFAAMDDYRYTLYNDLDEINKLGSFPSKYNNQTDLAKSKLFVSKSYERPDSILYVEKLSASIRSKQGYVYFFKYKEKKDDQIWKLATVGLLSTDPGQFEIKDSSSSRSDFPGWGGRFSYAKSYDFTQFTDSKLKEDESILSQLNKQLRKMLYSTRQSARQFYNASNLDLNNILRFKN